MRPPPNDGLLTVREAAEQLGCLPNQVYNLISRGLLDAEVYARHVYVDRDSLATRIKLLELPEHNLTLAETAEFLGVSRRTISEWVHKGRLSPISTATGRTLFNPVDVARLAAYRARTRGPRPGPAPGTPRPPRPAP